MISFEAAKHKSAKIWQRLTGYVFLLPSAIVLATFVFIPMAYALVVSFTDWDLMSPRKFFVGFSNYAELLTSEEFWLVARNTLVFTVTTVPISTAIGLVLALALNRNMRLRTFYRAAYFLPVVTSTVAVSIVWMWIYHPNYGLMNQLLGLFGIPPQRWLSHPNQALPAIIIVSIWKRMGYDMVIYLAGLQGIPVELYEAAKLDGANKWQLFKNITWPLLTPTTFFLITTSLISSVQVFSIVHTMTSGGPANRTNVVVYYLYQQAFNSFRMGYAFSIAYVLFVLIFIVTIIQMRFSESRVHYQ